MNLEVQGRYPMIYTLTINPSLDYVMEMEHLAIGEMNRSKNTYLLPGGKGINVSCVLKNLGVENVAILPVAGFTGDKLLKMLSEKEIVCDALPLNAGNTRINVKVLGQKETELNADGPKMTEAETSRLFDKFEKLQKGDYLVLSGSVPKHLGDHFYEKIMQHLEKKEIRVVLDTIGENFLNALPLKPFLVKPNKEELEGYFQKSAGSEKELIELAKKVQSLGAVNVLVSLGKDGAFLLEENGQIHKCAAPKGKVINSVGAGDSMVAGFLAEYIHSGDMISALKCGIAAGSASAFSKNLATKEEIDALMQNL